tara:strand:- start:1034 stop:1300 length:267 start_codon:yes stop_codon:yes gene_type:complete
MSEEDAQERTGCPCNGENCSGGYGWKWRTADLGNRIAGHKAGQTWVEVCSQWDGDELPPNPPGIPDITKYMPEHGRKNSFHNQRRGGQ